MQCRINDYGVIGDCRSAALISRGGSIDWLCWPRFESPPLLGALLDGSAGRWTIAPVQPFRATRRYVEDTNVLETRFETATGSVTAIELMTIVSEDDKRRMLVPEHELLRRYTCTRGEVALALTLDVRPSFGARTVRPRASRQLGVRWELGAQLLALRGEAPIELDDEGVARATVALRGGESVAFSLTADHDAPTVVPPLGPHAIERIDRALAWWRSWSRRATYDGPDRDAVIRGALAVKLMSYAPSGAIVAAPTTSLPERIGGSLNWDYRYCWLRDAAFTSRALLSLGFAEDASAFGSWLLHATRLTSPELRVLYDVYGNAPHTERELAMLDGFCGSRPVRTGNAARGQLQIDVYGEVIDAIARIAREHGALDRETQHVLRGYGEYVCGHWRLPDQGIWEPRTQPEHRTHSRLLCWVALDRLLELATCGVLAGIDRARYAAECAAIRDDIEQHAFDERIGSYTGAYGVPELDASVLLMSWYGFHAPHEPRMRSTFARIRERLAAGRGLLYRYERSLRKREGAFWICSFWAVEHLARGGGTLAEARAMFEAAKSHANDLGLMSEEVDPRTGHAIGNFPQAYTHVGLISAALSLEERERTETHGRRRLDVEARA